MSITQDDIVAVGGDLTLGTLLAAYRRGVFPWPVEGLPLLWFCPRERAVLAFADLRRPEPRAGRGGGHGSASPSTAPSRR
jgi:Leu/Phe-tRNA-protein transferase